MGLSRLSKKCQDCGHVDICQNKRMEACAYIGEEKPFEPGMRATMNVVTDENVRTIYKDEIEKQLNEHLYSQFDVFGRY